MLGIAFLFLCYQGFLRSTRCNYCGAVNGHDDSCPYDGSGTRMK